MSKSPSPPKPKTIPEPLPILCHSLLYRLCSDIPRPLLSFAMSALGATAASRMLPHIDAHAHPTPALLCIAALLLNVSAAFTTVTLTGMKIQLDFRLESMQRLERIPRLLYLNWIACMFGGMACLIAVLVPYGSAIFTWT